VVLDDGVTVGVIEALGELVPAGLLLAANTPATTSPLGTLLWPRASEPQQRTLPLAESAHVWW